MRNLSIVAAASFGLALSACSTVPERAQAGARATAVNRGDVSGERVEANPDQRYQPEQGVTYDPPTAFPDNPSPVYPPSLLPQARAPVVVAARIVVDGDGSVRDVIPIGSADGADVTLFVASVRAALMQWKFFPLVRIVEGGPKTVVTVGDVSTTYDGQATRLPFSQEYKFTFSQMSGVPSVGASSSEITR